MYFASLIRRAIRCLGYDLIRVDSQEKFSPDIPTSSIDTYRKVSPYTMTSPERIFSLCDAIRYIHDNNIEGHIVECGVWKGGSMMAIADTLLKLGDNTRHLHLFDTFDGMTAPSENDVDVSGVTAESLLKNADKEQEDSIWCKAGLDTVKKSVESIGYPNDRIHYIQGLVEQTIPQHIPEKIALLRLDTDWYESTHHEMEHLFPRLAKGGILIIDDYGHWQGARKAVDEYIASHSVRIFLNRIDYTGRVAVKLD
jgi:O-methyltransferase